MSSFCLLSGGIDSLALLHFLIANNHSVEAIHVSYGQKAKKSESRAAHEIAKYLSVDLKEIFVNGIETQGSDEILGRNLFLLSTALITAKDNHRLICLGVHSGTGYYDCSKNFHNKANILVKEMSVGRVQCFAPFLEWSKLDIFEYCIQEQLPVHLSYSCEREEDAPCGKCRSCKDREFLCTQENGK